MIFVFFWVRSYFFFSKTTNQIELKFTWTVDILKRREPNKTGQWRALFWIDWDNLVYFLHFLKFHSVRKTFFWKTTDLIEMKFFMDLCYVKAQ